MSRRWPTTLLVIVLSASTVEAKPVPPTAPPTEPACPPAVAPSCPPDGDTVESLRAAMACERLRAAAQLKHMACALRLVERQIEAMPEPPSRVQWLITGAAAVGIGCALIDPHGR